MDALGREWIAAGNALNFKVIAPYFVSLTDDQSLFASALIPDFGAPKGMLLLADGTPNSNMHSAILEAGYGYCCLSQPRTLREDFHGLVSVLKDWGWCGEGDPPAWLSEISAIGDYENGIKGT